MLPFLSLVATALASSPDVALFNAAQPGQTIPAMGLGSGGYGTAPDKTYPNGAECWIQAIPACGQTTTDAIANWLQIGGKRIDNANSYFNQAAVAKGIAKAGAKRGDFFFTSKIGSSNPMGYNDTLEQVTALLTELQMTYVDLLLVHWPTSTAPSQEPACNAGSQYDPKKCRLDTWKAMVQVWQQGKALAIGVSNYNQSHIQEIIDAGLPLPAVNQCPFNPYRSQSQVDLINFCKQNKIVFNGYSPIGIPDLSTVKTGTLLYHAYPAPMAPTLLEEPLVKSLATKYNVTAGQILVNFQWTFGAITNPRSQTVQHMKDNLNAYNFLLTAAEQAALLALPQDTCDIDDWYECAPVS